MSEFIICETQNCKENADLIIVYGCLEGHLADVLLCNIHYGRLIKELPATICGAGHHIDVTTAQARTIKAIKFKAANTVLLRPQQQAQMKKRIRGIPGAWSTLP